MKNNRTDKQRATEAGFTLIELTIVLLIISVTLGALGSAFFQYVRVAREKAAESRIEEIETALGRFLAMNGRYPCPARLNAAPDTSSFGVEATPNCASAAAGGTVRVAGTGGRMVRIGTVPVRALNLPDEYMLDPWSSRIFYSVTEVLTVSTSFAQNMGAISIVDTANNSVITPAGSGHYTIVSVGPDGRGSYSAQGVLGPACVTTALDGENCNNDAVFRATTLYSTTGTNTNFDDYITYVGARALDSGVPSGAVMAFNLNACPNGWAAYANAVGRAVIGTGQINETYNPGGRAPWTEVRSYALGDRGGFMTWRLNEMELARHSHDMPLMVGAFASTIGMGVTPSLLGAVSSNATLNLGKNTFDTGGDVPHENMPPYVALLYCQKL